MRSYIVTLVSSQAFLFEDLPHLPRRNRNIDMAHANMSQRIDDGVGNRLRRTNGGRFADAFGPNGMMRRWCNGLVCLPVWRLHRGGDQVVLEVAAKDIAIRIKSYLLVHRWSKPLRQATMNLPLDHHRVDDRTAVIHRHEAPNMHLSCATVDVHDTDVATERIREIGRIIVVHRLQAWLQVGWTVGIGRKSQLLDSLALAGCPLNEETPWLPLEVLLAHL